MKLKSMKMEEKEREEYAAPTAISDAPKYPYGLRIHLDTESLKKLGLEKLPALGEKMVIVAVAEVCDLCQSESEYGKNKSLGLQITQMSVESEAPPKDTAEELYS